MRCPLWRFVQKNNCGYLEDIEKRELLITRQSMRAYNKALPLFPRNVHNAGYPNNGCFLETYTSSEAGYLAVS
jgi:hypothetical protein